MGRPGHGHGRGPHRGAPHQAGDHPLVAHQHPGPEELDVVDAAEDDLDQAMDWLLERQDSIERKLAVTFEILRS